MPSAYKMARAPLLECFDLADKQSDPDIATKPSAEWCEGHAAGLTEGLARAALMQTALSADIAQCFSDMGFGYAEARAQLLHALKPLFGALIKRVLPGFAETALATQIVARLQEAAERDSSAPLELSVNPARIEGLSRLLPYAVGIPVLLIADQDVKLDQAVLRAIQSETLLDVGAVLEGVQTALEAIFETVDERVNHG